MNTSAKKQIIPELLVAVLWGILTLWTDRLFFRYDWRTTAFFVYKALFVLLAFLLVHGIVTLVKKLRAKDRFVWRWLQWTLPYLAVNLIVLLIVWPGCWGNDDLNVLSLARTLQMDAWQHFLTSSAFILSLMFVPIPGGVVLIQNLLISAAVGCFAATAQDLTEKRLVRPVKPVWFAIVYLPFLLPPVLMHNQNPFRTTWSCWCELFLVFMLVAFYLRGTRLTRAELTAVVVLGALAASWRSECVYYLAAIPVMLAVLCSKKLLRPLALGAVTALILCGYMASSRYTSSLMGEAWQYQRIALCYQMAALVQDADPAEDAAELAAIDKIYDVDYCRSHPEIHGNALREAILRNGGSDAEWKECRGAIARLALRYPKSLLRERLDVFNNTLRQRQNGRSNQKLVFASSFLMYEGEPERDVLCELFLVFMLVAFYLRGTRLTRAELTAVVVLGALAASWRSECVYYLAAIPVMLAVLCSKKLLRPLALGAVTALILCGYMASSRYTSSLMGEAWQYQRIALCYQMAALVQDADPAEDAAELAAIDKIYDVDYCRSHPEIHGNALREAILRNGGSDAEWKECRGAIARLALRYPKSLLRERLDVFNNTLRQRQNGRSNQKLVFASSFLMYEGEPERDVLIEFLQDSAAVKPLNQELRKNFIINVALSGDFAGGLIDWTWWMLPPFVLLFAACLVLLVRRRWMLLFAAGTFFVRIPLVFLTAPDTYFLYYLTPFIAGYAVTAAGIIYAVMKDKRKRERVTD